MTDLLHGRTGAEKVKVAQVSKELILTFETLRQTVNITKETKWIEIIKLKKQTRDSLVL